MQRRNCRLYYEPVSLAAIAAVPQPEWQVLNEDCLEVLKRLPDDCLHSMVTDPPAGIGFMGKEWDSNKGGRVSWIAWLEGIMREALRVLKPGAHALVWALPRTSHWTATALEQAGFEIRDKVTHHFGCLPEQDEILTDRGWIKGVDVSVGDLVATWDPATSVVKLSPVLAKTLKPYSGPLVRIQNDDTEQLLTPEHRVFEQRAEVLWKHTEWPEGFKEVAAKDIVRKGRTRLPLSGTHDGPGIGGERWASLLGWFWTEGTPDVKGTGVRLSQTGARPQHVEEIRALLAELAPGFSEYVRERAYPQQICGNVVHATGTFVEYQWYWSGPVAERVRAALPDGRPTWDLLWKMTQAEKLAFLASAMAGDGAQDPRMFAFYQKERDEREWFQTLLHLCGMSGRVNDKKSVVHGRRSATTEMTSAQWERYCSGSNDYDGPVWCVAVETGAFLARHNGRIFATGNTGFPKSLNVSKAIDDAAGAERQATGPKVYADGTAGHWSAAPTYAQDSHTVGLDGAGKVNTAPATAAAKQWDGWGTALKPATEDWILCRKPLAGTVAANVQAHGTGALNIDECRIEGTGNRTFEERTKDNRRDEYRTGSATGSIPTGQGRWPANLLLSHSGDCFDGGCGEGCPVAALDAQSGTTSSAAMKAGTVRTIGNVIAYGTASGAATTKDIVASRGGASRFFYCPKPSTAEREEGLAHLPKKRGAEITDRAEDSAGIQNPRAGAGRTSQGRANHHPTVKSIALMKYLVALVTPPGGIVLDLFCGSGTTGIAAVLGGWSFLGVEKDPEYAAIARGRIAHWLGK